MSKGSGRVERRIGELFAGTQDRALSITDIAAYAFELADGIAPNRKQRLSATRAAHRLFRRAAEVNDAFDSAFSQVLAETTAKLGRPPGGRGRAMDYIVSAGGRYVGVDAAFRDAMQTAPSAPAWHSARNAWQRERGRSEGLFRRGGWRATETKERRLWFHPADYPVRLWAVAIRPEGVMWAEAEITGIDNTYVRGRYGHDAIRLDRERLARSWTLWRNVYFTSSRSGYAAHSFDQMWRERYWRPGCFVPLAMQMDLAEAIKAPWRAQRLHPRGHHRGIQTQGSTVPSRSRRHRGAVYRTGQGA